MKKLAIAGASAVLAALPVVGVLAAGTSTQFTDTLTVTINGGCTLTNSQDASTPGVYTHSDREFTTEIVPGNVGYLNGSASGPSTDSGTVSVTCNTGSTDTTEWTVAVAVDGLTGTATSTTIPGGAATTGASTSSWAIQSNATGTTASNPFSSYAAAASTTFLTAQAKETVSFNPSYRVYVAAGQTPDSYVGHAQYTISYPQQP